MQKQQSMIGLASGGLLAMAAALGIGRFVYTPILPVMVESLGWSKAEATSFAFGQMIGPSAAGLLFDSLGSLRIPSLVAAGALLVAGGLAVAAERAVTSDAPARTSSQRGAEP